MFLNKEQTNFVKDNANDLLGLFNARVSELKEMAFDEKYTPEQRELLVKMVNEYKDFWIINTERLKDKYNPTNKKKAQEKQEESLKEKV